MIFIYNLLPKTHLIFFLSNNNLVFIILIRNIDCFTGGQLFNLFQIFVLVIEQLIARVSIIPYIL